MKETKYRIKQQEMERQLEEAGSKKAGRKDYEQFKEAERAYAKFTSTTGALD